MTRECARCGAKLTDGVWLRSDWTKSFYCTDVDACALRAKKAAA